MHFARKLSHSAGFRTLLLLTALFTVLWQSQTAVAAAGFIDHAGNIVPSAPTSSDTVDFWVQVGYQGWVTDT